MKYYGARELASGIRTVRKNTIAIAEDIPEEQYGFRPTSEVRTVAEQLAHIAVSTGWQDAIHSKRVPHISFELFTQYMQEATTREQSLRSKDQIIRALREDGEAFAAFVESLSEDILAEQVTFPPQIPGPRTRFEMLLSAKEHEMHHRGQLMLIERMLGIVPHLTRQRQAAAAPASKSPEAGA